MKDNIIGENIKKIRLIKGLTQKQLANYSGITRESIGNYERGDRIPPADILDKIAKAFKVPLFCLTDPAFTDLHTTLNGLEKTYIDDEAVANSLKTEFLKQDNPDRNNTEMQILEDVLNFFCDLNKNKSKITDTSQLITDALEGNLIDYLFLNGIDKQDVRTKKDEIMKIIDAMIEFNKNNK